MFYGTWVQHGSGPFSYCMSFYVYWGTSMKIKELRQTVRTYQDWELAQLLTIAGWDAEAVSKKRILEDELNRRGIAREEGTYYDETLPPLVSIDKRLLAIKKNISK
jgi:hypothetical protein